MKLAKKVKNFEVDRVEKHKNVREKQLVIEMENRTMQIIHENKKEKQEKEYQTYLKELSEERDFKFKNLHNDRKQHSQKVEDMHKHLNKLGYIAYEDHIKDVEARQEQAKKEEEILAIEAHARSTLAD